MKKDIDDLTRAIAVARRVERELNDGFINRKKEFKPLTLDSVPIDGFYFDGEDVRSAVMGYKNVLWYFAPSYAPIHCSYCGYTVSNDYYSKEREFCRSCELAFWFPIFFEEELSGVQK